MQPPDEFDTLVVGGGFFGCSVATHLARTGGQRVLVCEKRDGLLERASLANQARVHNGYHYPRSLLTALRCRVNLPRFVEAYPDAIVEGFDKYYAIGRHLSKVTAMQFRTFCERIGAPIEPAPRDVRRLFDHDLIEDVFLVREMAFDATRLRARVAADLASCSVELRLGCEVVAVRQRTDARLEATLSGPDGAETVTARRVLDCTYSRLNGLRTRSGLEPIRLKHELTEMALIRMPDALKGMAFTVMCGPYFSVMPFPSRGLHTLSHVRYTPHQEWHDGPGTPWRDPDEILAGFPRTSRFPHMIRDASRYLPGLRSAEHVDSLWEVKTVLPKSETDDSRPVLLFEDPAMPGLSSILGAKIDNIFDVLEEHGLADPPRVTIGSTPVALDTHARMSDGGS